MIFIRTKFGIVYAKDSIVNIDNDRRVEGILVFNESDEEICEVPFRTESELSDNPNLIEKILEEYY